MVSVLYYYVDEVIVLWVYGKYFFVGFGFNLFVDFNEMVLGDVLYVFVVEVGLFDQIGVVVYVGGVGVKRQVVGFVVYGYEVDFVVGKIFVVYFVGQGFECVGE